jgi:signal transduction histidine kinase
MGMSLRFRLILSHVLVIIIILSIVGVSLSIIFRSYQRLIERARLADAVVPLAFQARAMFQNDVPPREVVTRLDQQAGNVGRVMIITDKGLVLADAARGLTNRTIRLTNAGTRLDYVWGVHAMNTQTGNRNLLFAAVPAGQIGGQPVYIALSAFERPIAAGLQELVPSLLVAGAITLLVSLLAALILARSIAKPITQLTQATEAIARGHYESRVRVTEDNELGRLGTSFNTMAEQVQHVRQMEKDFLANVSHELKTPLTSIQGFSQAILDGAVQDIQDVQHAAQTIYDETTRMARLVGDLLTLARLESGELPLAKEKLDLAQLLPCWVDRLQPRARSLNETLVAMVDPLPPVIGDAGRLEQVVTNLVENALKYNHAGGSVTVSAKAETVEVTSKSGITSRRRSTQAPSTHWVTIAVADTGSGISNEDQKRLFERFYRGDKARVAGGTGLGLSIAYEIVAAHGGKLSVESEVGHGSTFTVRLPSPNGAGL